MSEKKNLLGKLALLASAAAVTVGVYKRREEIRAIISDAAARFSGGGEPVEEAPQEEPIPREPSSGIDVIIDVREDARGTDGDDQ